MCCRIFPEIFDCKNSVSACGGCPSSDPFGLQWLCSFSVHLFFPAFCSMWVGWKYFSCLVFKLPSELHRAEWKLGDFLSCPGRGRGGGCVVSFDPSKNVGLDLSSWGDCRNIPTIQIFLPHPSPVGEVPCWVVLCVQIWLKMKVVPLLGVKRWEMWGSRSLHSVSTVWFLTGWELCWTRPLSPARTWAVVFTRSLPLVLVKPSLNWSSGERIWKWLYCYFWSWSCKTRKSQAIPYIFLFFKSQISSLYIFAAAAFLERSMKGQQTVRNHYTLVKSELWVLICKYSSWEDDWAVL